MNDKQLKVLGLLKSGLSPKEISEETGIHYATVLSWKKKFDAGDQEQQISELASHEVLTLLQVKDELAASAPEIQKEVEQLIENVIGLKELEPVFHATMMRSIHRADIFLQDTSIGVKEWQMVTKTLSEAYAAIFNKSGTVVNVANNNISAGHEQVAFFNASKKN